MGVDVDSPASEVGLEWVSRFGLVVSRADLFRACDDLVGIISKDEVCKCCITLSFSNAHPAISLLRAVTQIERNGRHNRGQAQSTKTIGALRCQDVGQWQSQVE
jgi:hypothetical protein